MKYMFPALLSLGALLLCGCASAPATRIDLPRAAPSHVQWLEKQSLLRQSPEVTALVSGSSLGWRAPSGSKNSAPLLQKASVWLMADPQTLLCPAPALAGLQQQGLPRLMARLGLKGLYLSPMAENGSAWFSGSEEINGGRDAVSFNLAAALGSEEDYNDLTRNLAAAGGLAGGDSLPAATGLGPDFSLAIRAVRDYPGLYMLIEAAPELWPLLPQVDENAPALGLDQAQVAALAARGLIPPAFAAEGQPGLPPSGWAATGEVLGVDGVKRRWLYRYSGHPSRPLLNWDDPSGAAKRVLAASIIHEVGLRRMPLVGLGLASLWGQDPAPAGGGTSAEPGFSAMNALSRDVRRYGGWSLEQDWLPMQALPLAQPLVDFARDSVTSPALEQSLLQGDAAPLRAAMAKAQTLGVDEAGLWRSIPRQIPMTGQEALLPPAWRETAPLENGLWSMNGAALAAMALDLEPDQVKSALENPEQLAALRDILEAQLAFRAMRPGLLLLAPEDLAGLVFAPEHLRSNINPMRAGVALSPGGPLINAEGRMRGLALNAPLSDQLFDNASQAARLARLLQLREELEVAMGQGAPLPELSESAAAAALTRLPGGDYLLTAINVSGQEFVSDVRFAPGLIRPLEPGQDLISNKGVAVGQNSLRLRFTPWQYRIVRLKAGENRE